MRAAFIAALLLLATQAVSAAPQQVDFASADGAALKAYVIKPNGAGPFPTVVMLHGCGGLLNERGEIRKRELDWADRFVAAGYAVMLPDSFNPRGFRTVCTNGDRDINPGGRARDTVGAVAWLKTQDFSATGKVVIVGWSHGGSTVLRYVMRGQANGAKGAIAFYPGCTSLVRRGDWQSRIPLEILIGADDDWTPAEPCRQLAASAANVRLQVFPGAHHDFDAPDLKLLTRTGVAFSANGTGVVHLGTHEPSRQAAIATVMKFLGERFGP
jgi:dienelactone hydrolase